MNEIVNRLLLAGDKSMPEMHLQQPGFSCSACGPFTKTKKELKSFCKQEIQVIFAKMILIKLVPNMTWFMINTINIGIDKQIKQSN